MLGYASVGFWRGALRCLATGLLVGLACAAVPLFSSSPRTRPVVTIRRVNQAPVLEDFLSMEPAGEVAAQLTKLEGFIQRRQNDGEPATQPTEAYIGYDREHLYVIFVCFDAEPEKIRARMTRRDTIWADDRVEISLDTFNDQRNSYELATNPLGVQRDARFIDGLSYDTSFDIVWHSRGRLTAQGYVVWMAIPFKSLRFPATREQVWGISFWRALPRHSEVYTWPHVSTRIEGYLNQTATLVGLQNISPGRNAQLIPYGFFRSFRALDPDAPVGPEFVSDPADLNAGLDAKFVLQDSFALDVALNPDFSQVESDEPQVTVNRRFEVFFPEKRAFFLENAGFFETPMDLFFSRRIQDPQLGVRLTGKRGPYAIGALLADDQAPGKSVPPDDPLAGKRARFGVLRVSRDVFSRSSVGMIYTDRTLEDSFNRVGGVDGTFKLGQNWVAGFQGVTSSTRFLDGETLAGPAYRGKLLRQSHSFLYDLEYDDRSPGFFTETGFLSGRAVERLVLGGRTIARPSLRTDVRSVSQFSTYRFHPEGERLISWGPTLLVNPIWDHKGTSLHQYVEAGIGWQFRGSNTMELFYVTDQELLRPNDFAVLSRNQSFSHNRKGAYFSTDYLSQVSFEAEYSAGTGINFVPVEGVEPALANVRRANVALGFRPLNSLHIQNTYLAELLTDRSRDANIFNNHIVRSKWSWQVNRELTLRTILQYEAVLSNAELTSLETAKNFNADFLLTYLVTPWTALYVGYNGNLQNLDLIEERGRRELRRGQDFLNDARQFFVKFSYLVSF